MKHRFLLIPALVSLFTGAILLPLVATAISLSPVFELGTGGDKPAVAVGSDSHIHTVWGQAKTIQYVECDDLDPDSCADATTIPATGKASFPRIALDLQNRPNVVWQSKTKKGSDILWSRLENSIWSAPQKVSTQDNSTLADIAIGPLGNVHIVYQSTNKDKSYIEYVGSVGDTRFSAPVELDALNGAAEIAADEKGGNPALEISKGMNPRVAADSADRAHVVWNAPAPFGVFYTYQTNTDAFVAKKLVSDKNKDQMPALAIGTDDAVAIVWNSKAINTVSLAEYQNGARVYFGTGFPPGLNSSANPAIAADCWGGFQIAYQGIEPGNKKTQIFHRMYDPSTHTFDEQESVSNAQTETQFAAIAARGNGAIVFANTSTTKVEGSTTTFIDDCDNPPAPTPTMTPQDATEHIAADDPRIAYNGAWSTNPDSNASDDFYVLCGGLLKCNKEWSAELTFIGGTRVEWETAAAKTFGKARVSVDGQLFEQIDFCKLASKSGKLKFLTRTYVVTGNASTVHKLKITALGEHSGCATKNFNYVAVDGFNVIR